MVPGTSRPSLRRLGPVAGAALLALALPVLPAAAQELDYRAELVEIAVANVLDQGLRTADIMQPGKTQVSTTAMGEAVTEALDQLAA